MSKKNSIGRHLKKTLLGDKVLTDMYAFYVSTLLYCNYQKLTEFLLAN